jgi:diadenylate cyclase
MAIGDDRKMISTLLGDLGRYLLTIQITDIIDIAIMAFACYKLLTLVRSTKAISLFKGVLIFLVVLGASTLAQLHGISYILNRMVSVGVLALIILFQPEIRHVLEQVGSQKFSLLSIFAHGEVASNMEHTIGQTVLACTEMSKSRTGVLIVFERDILLDDMVRSGTVLDADVSSELLKNIFFVKAPMHDGAVIIRQGRILGAGCMLPLSKNVNLSRDLGMRHRAGIGMSENSDAVVVIVSEETGTISVAIGGMLKRHLTSETLENLLRNELLPQEPEEEPKRKFTLAGLLRSRREEDDDEK